MAEYASVNFGFSIYYDKIYKKEYLPSRIRYSQFFFYTLLFGGVYTLLSKKNGGSNFCPSVNGRNPEQDMSKWKYYSSDRAIVNVF